MSRDKPVDSTSSRGVVVVLTLVRSYDRGKVSGRPLDMLSDIAVVISAFVVTPARGIPISKYQVS